MSYSNNIPPLNEPPPGEVMSLAAFEDLMNSTSIDELYKYYDSDGTVDLDDTYAGSSSSSDCSDDESDNEPVPEDPNADIREAERRDRAAASRHNDQTLQDIIFETQVVLERLSFAAQPVLEEQPMSTRIVLANQVVPIFERYGGHGSMFRFSEDVKRFLEGGERVKRAGVQGRDRKLDAVLRFAPVDPAMATVKASSSGEEGKKGAVKRKMKWTQEQLRAKKEPRLGAGLPAGDTKLKNRETPAGQVIVPKAGESGESINKQKGILFKPAFPQIYTGLNHLKIPPTANNGRAILSPRSPASAFARFNLNSPGHLSFPHVQPPNRHAYSCTTHPTLNAHLATQPYNPISLEFTWPATSRRDGRPTMPTPGLLDAFNNILHLFNAEARFMLSYYVRKYDTPVEFGGSTGGGLAPNSGNGLAQNVEPPHALFRLGIAQYLWSKIGRVIDHKEVDELGLNPEARQLLGEVWERHPSTAAWWHDNLPVPNHHPTNSAAAAEKAGEDEAYAHESDFDTDVSAYDTSEPEDGPHERARKLRRKEARKERRRKRQQIEAKKREMALGGLNPMEKEVLARVTNVSVQTVDAYWDDMREKTRAWGAMKMWCAAMEKRMIRKAKVEGRW